MEQPLSNKQKIFVLSKIHRSNKWKKEEDNLLIELATKFNERSWKQISLHFNNKNPAQCRARYKRIRPGIIKGAWSKEEDDTILSLVDLYGKNWSLIAKKVPTRNGKQIRDRFLNYLDPEINRNKFTVEEDEMIIKLYIEYGSKWSTIAKFFSGRTGDMIKNRFYSCLRKKVISNIEKTNKKRIKSKNKDITNTLITPNTSSSLSINRNNTLIYQQMELMNYQHLFYGLSQMTYNNIFLSNCTTNAIQNTSEVFNNFFIGNINK